MTVQATREAACPTLAERLSEGPIPVKESLRYATLLGEALHKLHETGKSHGAVSPETILLSGDGIELIPPAETDGPAEVPADIFAFGTVLQAMLTSNVENGDAPADAEEAGESVDSLISACLAKDGRLPSFQKVLLELKLANLAARHSGVWAARRLECATSFRTEIARLEARQVVRLREQEISFTEKHHTTNGLVRSMQTEMFAMEGKLSDVSTAAESMVCRLDELENSINAAIEHLGTKLATTIKNVELNVDAQATALNSVRGSLAETEDLIGRVVDTVESKLSEVHRIAQENVSRLDILEQNANAASGPDATLENDLADRLAKLQADIEAQAAAVESVRNSTTQTDILVGRVVEAVESILDTGGPIA